MITGEANCNQDTGRFKYVGVGLLALLKIRQILLLRLDNYYYLDSQPPRRSKTLLHHSKLLKGLKVLLLADKENDSFCK